MSGIVVAVTGATGFVASELIRQLLSKGYTVRGTSPSLGDHPSDYLLLPLLLFYLFGIRVDYNSRVESASSASSPSASTSAPCTVLKRTFLLAENIHY